MLKRLLDSIRNLVRARITKIFLGIFTIMFLGGSLVLVFERAVHAPEFATIWESFWWALVTMTTVGYGDKVPVTTGGRLVGVMVMFAGVSMVSLLTATISSVFVAKKIREGQGLEKITMSDHIIICGWSHHAEKIIDSLQRLRPASDLRIVLVNDLSEERINDLMYKYRNAEINFVRGDFTREIVLQRANVLKAMSVIIVPDIATVNSKTADERTVLATLALKGISKEIKVIAFLMDRENQSHLHRAEVDEVVVSDEFGGYLLAANVVEPGVPQAVRELLDPGTDRNLHRRQTPKNLVDKSFGDALTYFYEEHSEIPLAIYREDESISVLDFLAADSSSLDAFIKRKLEESGHVVEQEQLVKVNVNPPKDYRLQDKDWIIVIGT